MDTHRRLYEMKNNKFGIPLATEKTVPGRDNALEANAAVAAGSRLRTLDTTPVKEMVVEMHCE